MGAHHHNGGHHPQHSIPIKPDGLGTTLTARQPRQPDQNDTCSRKLLPKYQLTKILIAGQQQILQAWAAPQD